jgi:hypothetical protein
MYEQDWLVPRATTCCARIASEGVVGERVRACQGSPCRIGIDKSISLESKQPSQRKTKKKEREKESREQEKRDEFMTRRRRRRRRRRRKKKEEKKKIKKTTR